MVNKHIDTSVAVDFPLQHSDSPAIGSYRYYLKNDILDIATGFFLHDIGKTLIPEGVPNKKSRLTEMEFGMINTLMLSGFRYLIKTG